LTSYSLPLQSRCRDLITRTLQYVGRDRIRVEKGSYSVPDDSNHAVAAKIVMCEGRHSPRVRGSRNTDRLQDGIYVLIAVHPKEMAAVSTLSIMPWHNSQYAYFRLGSDADLDEIAAFIAACACRHSYYEDLSPAEA
jgi:hypothetical protein